MVKPRSKRCAIYTRKSSEEGLDQSFNSLDAQREACEAYIQSQKHEGWVCVKDPFNDGGFSGGNMKRPALSMLIEQIKQRLIDVIVVYKVDRLSRSLADFAKLVELFDEYDVSFVSVTQQFNTSTSMGRLTLNVLLSFAQFEREVTGERIRDKIAASKKKGLWMGGNVPLGYVVKDRQLKIDRKEARTVKIIFDKYLEFKSVRTLKHWLDESNLKSKTGHLFSRGALYTILRNPVYIGKIRHKDIIHEGLHATFLNQSTWDKVQLILNKNKTKQANRLQSNALLAGILFDDQHNAMSPTHTRKKNKRYSYYVSQALLLYRDREAGSIKRINMQEANQAIQKLLESKEIVHKLLMNLLQYNAQAAPECTKTKLQSLLEISKLSAIKRSTRIKQLLDKIIISKKQITLTFALHRIASLLSLEVNQERSLKFTATIQWQKWGSEQKLILNNSNRNIYSSSSLESLQAAILKAWQWNEELQNGKAKSIKEIADKENVTSPYVRRILRLAYLSPNIFISIDKGVISSEPLLEEIRSNFSPEWHTQETRYLS